MTVPAFQPGHTRALPPGRNSPLSAGACALAAPDQPALVGVEPIADAILAISGMALGLCADIGASMEVLTEPTHGAGKRVGARLSRLALYRWWRRRVVGPVDHQAVVARIFAESCWSPRYAFMTMMSAGIAMLGLLLSSPAVVIGAMLISPLMSPILGSDSAWRCSILPKCGDRCWPWRSAPLPPWHSRPDRHRLAVAGPTAEIVSRTRPNLFDLGVALFAALAGSFAIIRGGARPLSAWPSPPR
jgi:hypothetical protein